MGSLEKIADVFDLMAEYVDTHEREKQAAADTERKARLDKIAAAHLAAHGEEMPDAARQKLASTDLGTLDVVEDLLKKQGGALDALGGPADGPDTATTKQAGEDPDSRFLSWITSE